MDREPQPENPYSSPTTSRGEGVVADVVSGAIWEDGRVTIEFLPTVDDYVAAEMYRQVINIRSTRWALLKLLLVIAALPWVCLLFSANPSRLLSEIWLWAIVCPVVFLFLLGPWRGRKALVKPTVENLVKSDANEYLTPVRVAVTHQGFTCGSADGYRVRYWKAVEKIVSLPEHFLLVRGKTVTLILPKRVFAGPEEINRFQSMVLAYAPVVQE